MNRAHRPACLAFREAISARIDGELDDERALLGHLAGCGACREHERALLALAPGFVALRTARPPADLWQRIERRTQRRRATPIAWRVAAAIPGYLTIAGAMSIADRSNARAAATADRIASDAVLVPRGDAHPRFERHAFSSLVPREPVPAVDTLFAAIPEYQLLRRFPAPTEDVR